MARLHKKCYIYMYQKIRKVGNLVYIEFSLTPTNPQGANDALELFGLLYIDYSARTTASFIRYIHRYKENSPLTHT